MTILWDKHPHIIANGIVGQSWSKPCEALNGTLSSRYFELENEKWVVLFVLLCATNTELTGSLRFLCLLLGVSDIKKHLGMLDLERSNYYVSFLPCSI